ncbi:MAG: anti-sigma factor [Brachybacterium sp.]|nr:anti-sigma factor [Brachybacterium sp.]
MNEQKHTMTGAWALNALDAEEREQVRRCLEEDPEAAAEAAGFEETAAELAASLPPLAPRPELKAAVMARLSTTRQLSPLSEEELREADAAEPVATAQSRTPSSPSAAPSADDTSTPPSPPARVVSLDRYRASVRRGRWSAVAAAALLLTTIAGAGLWNSERIAEQEARTSLEAMATEQASAEAERATLSTILASDDVAHLAVPSQDGGSLQLMYSREQQAMLVQAADLPTLPEDEAYQLWMIDDSGITSAGMLQDPADAVTHEGEIPEDVTVGLTIEPAGGSEQPTMDPIAAGVLS